MGLRLLLTILILVPVCVAAYFSGEVLAARLVVCFLAGYAVPVVADRLANLVE